MATKKSTTSRSLLRESEKAARKLRRVFENEKIYVSGIPASVVAYMFLTKSFHVHQAVLKLCKAQMPSEAYALSRIMVEMFIVLRWITNQDQNTRANQYAFFVTKRKEYWAKILQQHNAPGSAGAVAYVQRLYGRYLALYSRSKFWTRENLKDMALEPEALDTAAGIPNDALWDYEVIYSMSSDHVHATVAALDPLVPAIGATYKALRVSDKKLNSNAIFTATAWLFKIVRRVDVARRLGLERKIDRVYQPFAKLAAR